MAQYFENKDICTKCGGKCCKTNPGVAYPEDFEMDKGPEKLQAAIKTGKWAIDWWEGDPGDGIDATAYFVRPAIKGHEGETYHPGWGGECTMLTKVGCSLEAKDRPKECRDLEPFDGDEDCIMHNSTGNKEAALVWRKHFNVLDSFKELRRVAQCSSTLRAHG